MWHIGVVISRKKLIDCNEWNGFKTKIPDSKYVTDGSEGLGDFSEYLKRCEDANLELPLVFSLNDLKSLEVFGSKILLGYHAEVAGGVVNMKNLDGSEPTFAYLQGKGFVRDHPVITNIALIFYFFRV